MTDKHRPEMIPKPYKNRDMPCTLPQYHPAFSRGLQGRKSPKMTPGIYRFTAYPATPQETAERSVTHATHEQEAAAGMVFLPQPPQPYHLQRPMPGLYPRLQAEFPGYRGTLPPVLLQTLEKGGHRQCQITANITTSS